MDYIRNLPLADPAFYQRIYIRLAANVLPYYILDVQHTGSPIAVNSIFEWIVMDRWIEQPVRSTFNLNIQLQKFWKTEKYTFHGKIVS